MFSSSLAKSASLWGCNNPIFHPAQPLLRTELCSPANSYVETLTPSVPVFGDGAFRKVIKVK